MFDFLLQWVLTFLWYTCNFPCKYVCQFEIWWRKRDSNSYAFRRSALNGVRLPVTPFRQTYAIPNCCSTQLLFYLREQKLHSLRLMLGDVPAVTITTFVRLQLQRGPETPTSGPRLILGHVLLVCAGFSLSIHRSGSAFSANNSLYSSSSNCLSASNRMRSS